MHVAAIMPCRGRAEQTVRNAKRLLATAGYEDWRLYLAGATPDVQPLARHLDITRVSVITVAQERSTYWQSLQALWYETDAPLLCGLANDLLPGMHWLGRGVEAYQET